MRSILRAMYSPRGFDVLFLIVAIASVHTIYTLLGVPIAAITPPADPVAKMGVLLGLAVLSCGVSTLTSRFDQKIAEDFVFHTLTKSAFIAIIGFAITSVLWFIFFVRSFGSLPSMAMMMLCMSIWSISYFIVRIRGTGA